MNSASTTRGSAAAIIAAAFLALSPLSGQDSADNFKIYRNVQEGYSLAYPKPWRLKDLGDLVEIRSFDLSSALTIKIENSASEDESAIRMGMSRFLADLHGDVLIGDPYYKYISKYIPDKWSFAEYSKDDGSLGLLYAGIRGRRLILIDTYFNENEARIAWESLMEGIRFSFAIDATGVRTFTDDDQGVSFEYPDNVQCDGFPGGFFVRLNGSGRLGEPFANIMIKITRLEEIGLSPSGIDELGLLGEIKEAFSGSEWIEKPVATSLSGNTWFAADIRTPEDIISTCCKIRDDYFAVVIMRYPANKDEEQAVKDKLAWKALLGSLSIDMDKWISYMEGLDEE